MSKTKNPGGSRRDDRARMAALSKEIEAAIAAVETDHGRAQRVIDRSWPAEPTDWGSRESQEGYFDALVGHRSVQLQLARIEEMIEERNDIAERIKRGHEDGKKGGRPPGTGELLERIIGAVNHRHGYGLSPETLVECILEGASWPEPVARVELVDVRLGPKKTAKGYRRDWLGELVALDDDGSVVHRWAFTTVVRKNASIVKNRRA